MRLDWIIMNIPFDYSYHNISFSELVQYNTHQCESAKILYIYLLECLINSIHILVRVLYKYYCHSPIQPQLKLVVTKCLVGPPTPPPPPSETFKTLIDNLGSWFLVCNLISTQPDKIWKTTSIFAYWKTTSIFWKMEDDLNFFENGRRPQFKRNKETTLSFK